MSTENLDGRIVGRQEEALTFDALDDIVGQTREYVTAFFDDQPALFEDGIRLEVCEREDLQDRFPALIEEKLDEPSTLYFEETQFSKLVRDISARYEVTPAKIAQLYIGCSLTTAALEHGVSPNYPAQVDRLYTVLSSTEALTTAIQCVDESFGDEERFMTTLNVMTSSEERICQINALRFAVGAFFVAMAKQGSTDYGDLMTESFRNTLHETLAGRAGYLKLFKALGNTKEQAERSFADKISLLELAVCFPMSAKEVEGLRSITRFKDNRIYNVAQEVVVDPADFVADNGFYDAKSQETRSFGTDQ